jgi:hypothetical protein
LQRIATASFPGVPWSSRRMLAGTKTRAKSLRGTGGHSRSPLREPGSDGTTDVADAFPDGEAYPEEWLEAGEGAVRDNPGAARLEIAVNGRIRATGVGTDVLIHPGVDYTFRYVVEAVIEALAPRLKSRIRLSGMAARPPKSRV